jgi:hypothetical protein
LRTNRSPPVYASSGEANPRRNYAYHRTRASATVYAGHHATSGVINADAPLQMDAFAGFVQSLGERLRGPEFAAVWQVFYDSFHAELLPLSPRIWCAQTAVPPAGRARLLAAADRRAHRGSAAVIEQAMAALRAAGLPYLHIAGDEPGTGYRKWLGGRLPAATIEVAARKQSFTRCDEDN